MACVRTIETGAVYFNVTHDDNVVAVAYSRTGVIKVRDMRTGRDIRTIDDYEATSIALSPSAPLLAATRRFDFNVYVWDYTTNARATVLRGHTDIAICAAFSPDGRLLISTAFGGIVRLWRTDDWAAPSVVLKQADAHPANLRTPSGFSRDSRWMAFNSSCHGCQLWHVAPDLAVTPAGFLDIRHLTLIAVHPEGRLLAVCMDILPTVHLVSVNNGTIGGVVHELKHVEPLHALAFSPCGRQLAVGCGRHVRLWDVATGARIRSLQGGVDNVRRIAYILQGKQLLATTYTGDIQMFTMCPWSDHTHHLFGSNVRSQVFQLMCVRAQLMSQWDVNIPIELWLMVLVRVVRSL